MNSKINDNEDLFLLFYSLAVHSSNELAIFKMIIWELITSLFMTCS
jgi:hypothetical protein